MAATEPTTTEPQQERCPDCGGPVVVRMRVDTEVPAYGFIGREPMLAVVIDRSLFDSDVWEMDEVVCSECGHQFSATDYEAY